MYEALKKLRVKIYADGADVGAMKRAYAEGLVKGFTTNPTLMKKAGVTDYKAFAKTVLREITELPVAFEVFSDDFGQMEKEARELASWGRNVYVKIPITDTRGRSSASVIRNLSADGVQLNVTAILSLDQVREAMAALSPKSRSVVSVFAGRVADTGVDPVPHMKAALELVSKNPNAELLWASPREMLNIFQADACGCHIITVVDDILKKAGMVGMDLGELSLETVKMFYRDANALGFTIQ